MTKNLLANRQRVTALHEKDARLNLKLQALKHDATSESQLFQSLFEQETRGNISPLNEAAALKRLIKEMGLTKQALAQKLGKEAAWVSIRLGLDGVSADIRALVDAGLVEDVRTLHELKQLESENPLAAKAIIHQIQHNQLSGAYRSAISAARRQKEKLPTTLKSIRHIQKQGNRLVLHVGGKHPLEFKVSDAVWARCVSCGTEE